MIGLKEQRTRKRDLFGGALRCAGLAAAAMTANAMGDFLPEAPDNPALNFNITTNYATLTAGGYFFNYNYNVTATFAAPTNYTGAGGSLSSYAGSTLMGASSSMDTGAGTWSYAYSGVVQYFSVDSTLDVLMEWDFVNGYQGGGIAYVFELGTGPLAVETSGAGFVELTLETGNEYYFVGRAGTLGGDTYARLSVIPAPGAMSLLGIGLVTARRRRRRE